MDPTGCPALDDLVQRLERELAASARGTGVARLLADYASSDADWARIACWSEERYTRNLIARRDDFELLLLCWGPGQESPIHNHEDQSCWMAVLEGEIEEVRYAFPRGTGGPLEPLGAQVHRTGSVAFIRDEIGLHLVRGHRGGRGVSLHVYAAPYDACNVYCPRTGRVERVRLSYHSVRGVLATS